MQRRLFLRAGLAGAVGLAAPGLAAQSFGPEPQSLPVEIVALVDDLPGLVTLGNRKGDVRLIEFFDYNCPFCRNSSRDIRPMLQSDGELSYALVNYAVLSAESVEATRVALAFSRQKAGRYLEFHEQLFARRGRIGVAHALEVALALGADREELVQDADSDAITGAMVAALRLGEALGMQATPSYLAGRESFQGYLNLSAKKIIAANLRACEKAVC